MKMSVPRTPYTSSTHGVLIVPYGSLATYRVDEKAIRAGGSCFRKTFLRPEAHLLYMFQGTCEIQVCPL